MIQPRPEGMWRFVAAIGIALVAGLAIGSGLARLARTGHQPAKSSLADVGRPTALVSTAPLRTGRIEEMLVTYGTVTAALGETHSFSVPFESRVLQLHVVAGQSVTPGDALVDVEPSPDTQLALEEARREQETASDGLRLVKERLDLKLATRQDVLTASARLRQAEARLDSLIKRGVDGPRTLRAEQDGIISSVDVQEGQIIVAGGRLLSMIGQGKIAVRLGVELEDVDALQVDAPVTLVPVNTTSERAEQGTIHAITRQVNPATRLVDVYVTPAPHTGLKLNEYVRAQLPIAVPSALIAPREAIQPRGGSYVVYTIENGRAVEHKVEIGIESETEVQVVAPDLRAGTVVAVTGAVQLTDGMAVRVETPQ